MFKNKKEYFHHEGVAILYRLTSKEEMSFSPFFEFEFEFMGDHEPVLYIEWIENKNGTKGQGQGRRALTAFIESMDGKGLANHVILQSNFHEDNYNETWGMELSVDERFDAINRLVGFYESVGFSGSWEGKFEAEHPRDAPSLYYTLSDNLQVKIPSTLSSEEARYADPTLRLVV